MDVTPEHARQRFRDEPVGRTLAELYCLYLTFIFHDKNHDLRKFATIVLVGVWAVLEVGAAFELATLPEQFVYIRLLVGVLVGRMWGIEFDNFAGLAVDYPNSETGEDGDSGDE
jgi:hypothetical protein